MKSILLTCQLILVSALSFAQTFIYCTGAPGSYQSGWTDGITRYDDTIRCTGTTKGGYAVFDLSGIPAGSVINSVSLVFYTDGLIAGTSGNCNTYGYGGDLSLVTDPATLFADLTSGTLLFSDTGTAVGGYGDTGHDSICMGSTAAPFTSFIAANTGGKVSICLTGGGSNEFRISGYYGTGIQPHLKISYLPPCSGTPGGGYITASNSLACSSLTTTLTNASTYSTWGNSFQWQSSPDSTTWTNIAGATDQTYNNPGITTTTYFRDIVTCSVSGLSGYSAGKKLTYAPCCSGMPTPGAATASTTFCDGCTLTLNVAGYVPQPGLTNQWQLSPDSNSWYNIPLSSYPTTAIPCTVIHNGAFYYRDLQSCSLSGGLTGASPGVFVGFPYSFNSTMTQWACTDPTFSQAIHGWSPEHYVKTQYGDGSYDSTLAIHDSTGSHLLTTHHYAFPGNYTVKNLLYNSNHLISSNHNSLEVQQCNSTAFYFYHDTNQNCIRDTGEHLVSSPFQFRIDSNGITIDTLTTTSGLNYRTFGSAGTIYGFTSLDTALLFCTGTNVFYDTILSVTTGTTPNKKYIGVHCIASTEFDLGVHEETLFTRGQHMGKNIFVNNSQCSNQDAVVTVTYSPKYTYTYEADPLPDIVSGNTLTWYMSSLGATSEQKIYWRVENSPITGHLWAGDTVHTCVTISPTAGDSNPSNNTECVIDTVTSSYDPNELSVSPSYCLPSDTATVPLQYTINFNNVGNDTAFNIYVLDTLPDFVDPMSMKIIAATDSMLTTRLVLGGHNVVKFDFPGINLPDTGRCSLCSGGVAFSVNLKPNLPDGTVITNQAGVYFDYNPVCWTNSVTNVTGCWVNAVQEIAPKPNISIYPNPATGLLNIDAPSGMYTEATVSNGLGQIQSILSLHAGQNTIDVHSLPTGLYFVSLRGQSDTRTLKFVKAE